MYNLNEHIGYQRSTDTKYVIYVVAAAFVGWYS